MDELKKRKLSQFYKSREDRFTLDDITINDLDLDDFFEKSDFTVSSFGEEVLYAILRQPCFSKEQLSEREELINKYSKDETGVLKIQKKLSEVNKLKKISVFEYLRKFEEAPQISVFTALTAIFLTVLSLCVIPFNAVAGVLIFAVVFVFNCISYFKLRGKVEPYFISIYYITRAIKIASFIPETDKENLSLIKNIKKGGIFLGKVNGITINSGSGNPLDVLLDFLRMALHFDILAFIFIQRKIKNYYTQIAQTLEEIGYIDACISIGIFRKQNENYCIPVLNDFSKPHLSIKDGFHPLLKNPVSNSVYLDKSMLITGSNASGKSTFLRMCGLCAILAQTYHCVPAAAYEGSFFRVLSSMKISDSIGKNESFYIAEVRALKRILDAVDENKEFPVLSITDEVLRGTNTVERIAASSQIIKHLSKQCLSICATHDIELTFILENDCINYHFNEEVSEEDIKFSFILKEGRADSRNAIKLLKLEGFPSEIIENSLRISEDSDINRIF